MDVKLQAFYQALMSNDSCEDIQKYLDIPGFPDFVNTVSYGSFPRHIYKNHDIMALFILYNVYFVTNVIDKYYSVLSIATVKLLVDNGYLYDNDIMINYALSTGDADIIGAYRDTLSLNIKTPQLINLPEVNLQILHDLSRIGIPIDNVEIIRVVIIKGNDHFITEVMTCEESQKIPAVFYQNIIRDMICDNIKIHHSDARRKIRTMINARPDIIKFQENIKTLCLRISVNDVSFRFFIHRTFGKVNDKIRKKLLA